MFALVLGTVATIAANPEKLTINEKLRTEIGRLLEKPNFLEEEAIISAKVDFLVNKNGQIVVIMVDSKDDRVVSFIKERLNYKTILDADVQLKNNKFSIPVKVVTK